MHIGPGRSLELDREVRRSRVDLRGRHVLIVRAHSPREDLTGGGVEDAALDGGAADVESEDALHRAYFFFFLAGLVSLTTFLYALTYSRPLSAQEKSCSMQRFATTRQSVAFL